MNPFKLFWMYLRVGVMNELQYRMNFFIQLLQTFIAVAIGLIGLSLVFSQVNTLSGWSRAELLAVMGVHLLMGGVIRASIQPNMNRFMGDVREGTLDFALIKPVDTQFLVSIREFSFWQLVDVLVGLVVMGVSVAMMGTSIQIWQALGFVAALVMGALMIYCVYFMVTALAFWIIRVDEIVNLFEGIYAAGRWPVSIYPDWLRTGLTFLVPVAFAVTVPAEALTNRLSGGTLLGALGLTVLLLAMARGVWKLGLRSYGGASA